MEPIVFVKGLIIGFALAVPIGPAGVLCIRKTLAEGRAYGLMIGLGAATADAFYSGVAAFGLTYISDIIASQHLWLRLGGGGLLLILGVRTLRAHRTDHVSSSTGKGLFGSYISTVVLGLTNPVTMVAFLGVFAAFGLGQRLFDLSSSVPVLGVFIGSFLWFVTLGYIASVFRKKLRTSGLTWVNRIAGILLILSGVAALVSVI